MRAEFRIECSETLKLAALHSPLVAFSFISGRVADILKKPVICGDQGNFLKLFFMPKV